MDKLPFLWKEAVFSRYGNHCIVCGKQASFPHHFKSRGANPSLTYVIENGIPLCWIHHNDDIVGIHGEKREEIEKYIIDIRGEEWLYNLNKLSQKRKSPPDEEVETYLRNNIE